MNPQSVKDVAKHVTTLTKDEYIAVPKSRSEDPHFSMAQPPQLQLAGFGSATYQYREFVCGWGAAFANITVTFPINKVMFRQQLHAIGVASALRQLRKEGLLNLYRGLMPPLLQKSTSMAIMFGMYHQFQGTLFHHFPALSDRVNKASAAMLAGTAEAFLAPFERIQTLLQDKHYHERYRNTAHAFRALSSHGLREYYRGLTPILLRNGPSNVFFFLFRGEIKKALPKTDSETVNILEDFVSGGLLGAFISTIFFPVNVIKTRMQSKVGGKFTGIWKTFLLIYRDRDGRVEKIYRGVHINYTRSLMSWGIINASYELLKKNLYSPHDNE